MNICQPFPQERKGDLVLSIFRPRSHVLYTLRQNETWTSHVPNGHIDIRGVHRRMVRCEVRNGAKVTDVASVQATQGVGSGATTLVDGQLEGAAPLVREEKLE